MSNKHIDAQMERMARELIAVAKALDCSVHLDVTKLVDGTFCGSVYKIGAVAADFPFRDGTIDFTGLAGDVRHKHKKEDLADE